MQMKAALPAPGNKLQEMLRRYCDESHPFSPLDAGLLDGDARKFFFDTQLDIFSGYQEKPQMVVGRRGAGKTAFLQSAHFTNSRDLIVSINKADALGQIVLAVNGIPQGGRYPEAIAALWDGVILTTILSQAIRTFKELKVARDYLGKIGAGHNASSDTIAWTLLNTIRDTQKGKTASTIAELIARLHGVSFHDAKQELFGALQQRGAKVIVLIDSLESEGYLFEDSDTVSALRGLLKWIGDTGSSRHPIEPRMSIPGEYYRRFLAISSNPLKDFAKCSILKWRQRQLMALAANRLRSYLAIFDRENYIKWSEEDLSDPKKALALFRQYLPDRVTLADGRTEDSFIYVLRHTQLIPRQLFIILNAMLWWLPDLKNRTLSPEEFRIQNLALLHDNFRFAVDIVLREIFGAYNHLHPAASNISQRVFPDLPEVFSYGELHKAYNRFGKREGLELGDFVDMLIEIGAIGRVVEKSGKYVLGEFQYNYDSLLVASSKSVMCMHPIFRLMYPNSSLRMPSSVWPIGVEAYVAVQ